MVPAVEGGADAPANGSYLQAGLAVCLDLFLEGRQCVGPTLKGGLDAFVDRAIHDEIDVDGLVRLPEALLMTDLDRDERRFRNKAGRWDIVHGPKGQWAVAMLPVDRDLALRVARTIVGHYANRQLKHIAERAIKSSRA